MDLTNLPDTIEYTIVIGMICPLEPGNYQVGGTQVEISFPREIPFGYPVGSVRLSERLPEEVSTVFRVRWPDHGGKIEARFRAKGFEVHLSLEKAFRAINQLISAYKLVRVGHSEGITLRTVGVADTLLYECFIGSNGPLIVNRRLHGSGGPNEATRKETNDLARPHIEPGTYPVARRFLKCFELFDRSYYNETTVLAHSILDDVTQNALDSLIQTKGLNATEAGELLRAIKERRLRLYLGPVLKMLTSKTVTDLWPRAFDALKYLNDRRNEIAHNGADCSKAQSAHCLFVATAIVSILDRMGVADVKFPPGMLRTARIESSWTADRPDWAPNPTIEELDPWDWP